MVVVTESWVLKTTGGRPTGVSPWPWKKHLAVKLTTRISQTHVGEDVEKLEPSYIAEGQVKWCSFCGKVWQFLKELTQNYHLYSEVYTPEELKTGV